MRRTGMSVVEVLVALMLVSIALIGMAGSTALAVRQITDGAARRAATDRAVSRLANLAAAGCLQASSGSSTDAATGLAERWTISGTGNFALVTDTVVWPSTRGSRIATLQSAFPC